MKTIQMKSSEEVRPDSAILVTAIASWGVFVTNDNYYTSESKIFWKTRNDDEQQSGERKKNPLDTSRGGFVEYCAVQSYRFGQHRRSTTLQFS